MYTICTFTYGTILPMKNIMEIATWLPIEGNFDFEFNTLEEAITEMKRIYSDKIYI